MIAFVPRDDSCKLPWEGHELPGLYVVLGSVVFGLAMGWHSVAISNFSQGKDRRWALVLYRVALVSGLMLVGFAFGGLGGLGAAAVGLVCGAAGCLGFLQGLEHRVAAGRLSDINRQGERS